LVQSTSDGEGYYKSDYAIYFADCSASFCNIDVYYADKGKARSGLGEPNNIVRVSLTKSTSTGGKCNSAMSGLGKNLCDMFPGYDVNDSI